MGLIQSGAGSSLLTVDATHKSARVSVRPADVIGWYSIGAASGALTGVAANGAVFSLRNTGAKLLLIRSLSIGFVVTTAFTTAQGLAYNLFRAQSFTVSPSGGTLVYSAGQNKHRDSFANITSAPEIRISSTAALTVGTRTLDTNPLGTVGGAAQAVGAAMPDTPIFAHDSDTYPIVLALNEGIEITNAIAMGAAGVIRLMVNIEYAEADAY